MYFAAEGTGGGCFDGAFAANVVGRLPQVGHPLPRRHPVRSSAQRSTCTSAPTPTTASATSGSIRGAFDEVGWSRGVSPPPDLPRRRDRCAHLVERPTPTAAPTAASARAPWAPTARSSSSVVSSPPSTARRQQGFARFSPSVSTAAPATPGPADRRSLSRWEDRRLRPAAARPRRLGPEGSHSTASGTAAADRRDPGRLALLAPAGRSPSSTTGLPNGASATYTVDAVDNSGLVSTPFAGVSVGDRPVRPPRTRSAVNADSPSFFWRLGEAAGSAIAADSSLVRQGRRVPGLRRHADVRPGRCRR